MCIRDREEVAVPAPIAVSSSSSSEEDVEKDLEMGLPQRPMVDSTANTDMVPDEKTPRPGGPCQPAWRYWRRNGPELQPRKPGILSSKVGLRPLLPSLPCVSWKSEPQDH